MAEFRTHYDNLQVARNASEAVIRAAYRILTQKHHPDKNPQDAESAHARITIINRAYEVLSDPRQRAEYDAWVGQQEADRNQNDSVVRERELLLKQQELARRVRQEERRRQQAEDELERVRAEFLKEKALARQRASSIAPHHAEHHEVSLAAALLTAEPHPAQPGGARPQRARRLRRATLAAATFALAFGGLFAASRLWESEPPATPRGTLGPIGPIAPVAPAPKEAGAGLAAEAKPPGAAAPPSMSVDRHASRNSAEQALAAGGIKPWNEAAVAALEKNQMWGPSAHGGADNFFIKLRNEGGAALNGVVFELSNQPCEKPAGARIAYYVFKFGKPLDAGQGASYPGKIGLNPDTAHNPSGMCGSIVSAW